MIDREGPLMWRKLSFTNEHQLLRLTILASLVPCEKLFSLAIYIAI